MEFILEINRSVEKINKLALYFEMSSSSFENLMMTQGNLENASIWSSVAYQPRRKIADIIHDRKSSKGQMKSLFFVGIHMLNPKYLIPFSYSF